MKITFLNISQYSFSDDIIFILCKKDNTDLPKEVSDIYKVCEVSNKFADAKAANVAQQGKMKTFVFINIDKEGEISQKEYEAIANTISSYITSKHKKVSVICHAAETISRVTANLEIALYSYDAYKTKDYKLYPSQPASKKLENLSIICTDSEKAKSEYNYLNTISQGVFLTKDLVNMPPNDLYPESYAKIIENEFKNLGVEVEILRESQMKELGMGALLGVGMGSKKESLLVIMKYNGSADKSDAPLAFVGKGVTFDSGGLSLKPPKGMETMKYDMGGSATVVGLMKTLALRKAKVNAVGVVGLVENMPSHNAQRPGDIVKTMSGITVEVLNTDAEGRLVLADALYYTATKLNPKFIINLATLTGAVMVALGYTYAGVFSNNDELAKKLDASAEESNENIWRLPLNEEYAKMLESSIADIANISAVPYAGSCTAAQFLKCFVKDVAWAHLDIAGMAFSEGKGKKGAQGFGVKLLNKLVEKFYE